MGEQDSVTTAWAESDRVLLQLMDVMADVNESGDVVGPSPLGVLCLVGETQCGKSSLIKHWAAEHGWRLLTVMPGVDSPEDLGGLPVREGDRLTWTQPSVIPAELLDPSWDGRWVLYLDEIEKAHPDVFNLLLQVMDYGTLTDNNGRKADFRNVIIIMTTNAGAEKIARGSMGFVDQDHSGDDMEVIKRIFSPVFRNRLDSVIRFRALDEDTILHVVDKFILQLEGQLADKQAVSYTHLTLPTRDLV